MLKKSRKLVVMLCVASLFSIVLAGCGGPEKKAAEKKETIRLGVNAEMTGVVSTFGVSSTNAMKLAVKEINAKGGVNGKQIELVFADNKSEPSEAAAAMTKLITQDKVAAVLGPLISATSLASTKIAQDNKIPMLSPSATNPNVTVNNGKALDYVFRSCFIDPFMGRVMADFAAKSLKVKNAAIYTDSSSDFSKGLGDVFEATFVESGGKIVSRESFLSKDTDFKATLTKIKATNPDTIFIPAYYQEVGMIVKQARELDINVSFVGVDGWDSPKLFEIGGAKALNNTYYSAHFSVDDKDPNVQNFVKAYQAEYKQAPDTQAALGYDCVLVMVDAIKRAGGTDPVKLKDALAATKSLQVATGIITMDQYHNPIKGAVINENIDGKVTFKEKINP